ncbi:MAG: hypothetical protein JSU04_05885 [Bdellovibrionales bacterium]|nr:hypothetical protein [Bdellovibrionales bacterium]
MMTSAHAQNMQWGTGMAMGQQGCGYQQRTGMGAVSDNDAVNDLLQEQKDLKQALQEKQRKQKTLERELEKLHDTISESLTSESADFAFAHMENGFRCEEYKDDQELPPAEVNGMPPRSSKKVSDNQNKQHPGGMSVAGITKYCDATRAGTIRPDICSDVHYKASENRRGDNACKKALPDYRKKTVESQKLASEIEKTQARLEDLKTDIADARREAREERQNGGGTEGDICLECIASGSGYQSQQQQRQTDWGGVAANLGTGLAAMYMGYQQNKMVAQYNSNAGWPTQSTASFGYGLPYVAAGLYGAMGGGTGQGSFGCGSSGGQYGNMQGGAFGYPQNMYGSPMGGGMYMSGMAGSMMSPYSSMYGYGNSMYGNSMGSMGLNFNLGIGGYGMGNSYMGMGSNYGSSNYLTQMQYQQMLYRMQMMNSSYGTYGNYGYNNNSYLTGTSSNPYVPIPAPSTSYNYTSSGIIPATTSSSAYVPIPAITTTNSYYNGR